jgi:hypothetical protein
LDLIEVPSDPLAAAKLRIAAVVFLEQLIELPRIHTGQAIVGKTDEDRPLSGNRAATRVLRCTTNWPLSAGRWPTCS